MNSVSHKEIDRQYRVLRQTLGIHSILRDEYSRKSKLSEILLLLCSVIFCATTFASDELFEILSHTYAEFMH